MAALSVLTRLLSADLVVVEVVSAVAVAAVAADTTPVAAEEVMAAADMEVDAKVVAVVTASKEADMVVVKVVMVVVVRKAHSTQSHSLTLILGYSGGGGGGYGGGQEQQGGSGGGRKSSLLSPLIFACLTNFSCFRLELSCLRNARLRSWFDSTSRTYERLRWMFWYHGLLGRILHGVSSSVSTEDPSSVSMDAIIFLHAIFAMLGVIGRF
jgi:hypothetical protein